MPYQIIVLLCRARDSTAVERRSRPFGARIVPIAVPVPKRKYWTLPVVPSAISSLEGLDKLRLLKHTLVSIFIPGRWRMTNVLSFNI